MEQCEENSQENDDVIIEKEISKLIEEQRLFTESIYACLPVGIEIYDAHGVLRSINDHALRMYGVDDRTSVVNIVNLYKSPFVDSELLARIQSGEDISLEFEYDFDRVNKDAYYSSHNKDTMIYGVKVIPIWSRKKHLIGHILLANDMTSVKEVEFRTEESKKNLEMAKKAQDLIAKRDLAMKVSNIVHWDFDVNSQKFESYNDPINDYVSDRLLTVSEYMDVIYPEDRSVFYDAMQSLIAGKNVTINFTCRIQTKYDETWQYCDFMGVPFDQDENGDIIRYTGFRQNIPKIQQLNRELKERNYKIELSFKTVGMSYWDFDVKSLKFSAFNDPINDFYSEKTITPEDYLNATHPDDVVFVRKYMEHMFRGIDKDFNVKYRSKTKWDDEWQTLLVTGIQVERDKEGHVTRYTGITINNTKWEKMIQRLKELKEKAELSDRLKSAFLANMSHEIRTPLNAIVGFSELMVTCDDPEEKKEYINIIQSNNELLLRLINDILDLSKIESGIIERRKENFNLAKVCNELFVTIQAKMTNPNVELRLDGPNSECWVLLDRNRLKQVWMNFLTNAVKCTKSGYIKMGYGIEREGLRIYVEDTGIGIPDDLHDKVFTRFEKLNEFSQGTGLGLTISRAIVEAAGGEVGFTSKLGVGSTFWAWLPLRP
ncbi:PAS domain-containing sensor histidine kinase [Parabacteroides distasonis]|uniref:PAS domain-containing sensor histidine kinase n=1 Tax=Parabacteroides distasonis TaxID=823 RepID=UPI0006C2BF35|nr:PAS domain-containing sensor histidine kinase [Parabacteroides distasonis]CUP15312.1 Sensory/regulatory protein RpfC [Parabacteroides distasonis]